MDDAPEVVKANCFIKQIMCAKEAGLLDYTIHPMAEHGITIIELVFNFSQKCKMGKHFDEKIQAMINHILKKYNYIISKVYAIGEDSNMILVKIPVNSDMLCI